MSPIITAFKWSPDRLTRPARISEADMPLAKDRVPLLEDRAFARLEQLVDYCGEADGPDGDFGVRNLTMMPALSGLRITRLFAQYPTLAAHDSRGEARPGYRRTFAAQRAIDTRP